MALCETAKFTVEMVISTTNDEMGMILSHAVNGGNLLIISSTVSRTGELD